MESKKKSIEIQCEIPVLCRILQRHALKSADCIPLDKSVVIIRCRNYAKKLCDRSIISAASEVLEKKLLKENENCDEVTLDISVEILATLLDCLTRTIELDFSRVIPLYAAAKRFGIHELSNEIKRRFTLPVCESFSRAKGILDKVSDSDVPYVSDLISGLGISTMTGALLCQALSEFKFRRGGGDESAFKTLSGILSAATKSDESPTPATACYLRGKNGQLLRVTGAQSDTHFGLSDDPRKIEADVTDNFVIKGDICILIKDGDIEVRPLEMVPGECFNRVTLRVEDLLGIDCSGPHIFVWSQHSVYSLKIENGRPLTTLLKYFEFEIGRVFAFEYEASFGLAVLLARTGELLLHDSQMQKYQEVHPCQNSKAVSHEYDVECSQGRAKVYDLRALRYVSEFPINSESSTLVDCVIRGSTIFVSVAVAEGTRLYQIDDGELTRKIVIEGTGNRFVRVVE